MAPAQLRRMRGLAGTYQFCVQPEQNRAFILDVQNSSRNADPYFIRLNLTNGELKQVKTHRPKSIQSYQEFCGVHLLNRAGKTYILALILEEKKRKFHLVSFAHKIANETTLNEDMSVVDEKYLEVERDEKFAQEEDDQLFGAAQYFTDIREDETGQLYFFIHWFVYKQMKTRFNAGKIVVNDDGKITTTILASQAEVDDKWIQPFIYSNTLYWIPFGVERRNGLLKMSLGKKFQGEIKTTKDTIRWPKKGSLWQWPAVIGQYIFYYAYHPAEKIGRLLRLDLKRESWKVITFDMNDHVVVKGAWLKSYQGRLYLHGECSKGESCKEKAHLYVIEVKIPLADSTSPDSLDQRWQSSQSLENKSACCCAVQ